VLPLRHVKCDKDFTILSHGPPPRMRLGLAARATLVSTAGRGGRRLQTWNMTSNLAGARQLSARGMSTPRGTKGCRSRQCAATGFVHADSACRI
jgi:hypothetical protein